jgi:hypothetical protein
MRLPLQLRQPCCRNHSSNITQPCASCHLLVPRWRHAWSMTGGGSETHFIGDRDDLRQDIWADLGQGRHQAADVLGGNLRAGA